MCLTSGTSLRPSSCSATTSFHTHFVVFAWFWFQMPRPHAIQSLAPDDRPTCKRDIKLALEQASKALQLNSSRALRQLCAGGFSKVSAVAVGALFLPSQAIPISAVVLLPVTGLLFMLVCVCPQCANEFEPRTLCQRTSLIECVSKTCSWI